MDGWELPNRHYHLGFQDGIPDGCATGHGRVTWMHSYKCLDLCESTTIQGWHMTPHTQLLTWPPSSEKTGNSFNYVTWQRLSPAMCLNHVIRHWPVDVCSWWPCWREADATIAHQRLHLYEKCINSVVFKATCHNWNVCLWSWVCGDENWVVQCASLSQKEAPRVFLHRSLYCLSLTETDRS